MKIVYQITQQFPAEERFGLIAQMRRSAISIPSNIAEGQARFSTAEFVHFVSHAEGSAAELDTQLTIATELAFCSPEQAKPAHQATLEIRRMLNSLRRKLQAKDHRK